MTLWEKLFHIPSEYVPKVSSPAYPKVKLRVRLKRQPGGQVMFWCDFGIYSWGDVNLADLLNRIEKKKDYIARRMHLLQKRADECYPYADTKDWI